MGMQVGEKEEGDGGTPPCIRIQGSDFPAKHDPNVVTPNSRPADRMQSGLSRIGVVAVQRRQYRYPTAPNTLTMQYVMGTLIRF